MCEIIRNDGIGNLHYFIPVALFRTKDKRSVLVYQVNDEIFYAQSNIGDPRKVFEGAIPGFKYRWYDGDLTLQNDEFTKVDPVEGNSEYFLPGNIEIERTVFNGSVNNLDFLPNFETPSKFDYIIPTAIVKHSKSGHYVLIYKSPKGRNYSCYISDDNIQEIGQSHVMKYYDQKFHKIKTLNSTVNPIDLSIISNNWIVIQNGNKKFTPEFREPNDGEQITIRYVEGANSNCNSNCKVMYSIGDGGVNLFFWTHITALKGDHIDVGLKLCKRNDKRFKGFERTGERDLSVFQIGIKNVEFEPNKSEALASTEGSFQVKYCHKKYDFETGFEAGYLENAYCDWFNPWARPSVELPQFDNFPKFEFPKFQWVYDADSYLSPYIKIPTRKIEPSLLDLVILSADKPKKEPIGFIIKESKPQLEPTTFSSILIDAGYRTAAKNAIPLVKAALLKMANNDRASEILNSSAGDYFVGAVLSIASAQSSNEKILRLSHELNISMVQSIMGDVFDIAINMLKSMTVPELSLPEHVNTTFSNSNLSR